MPPSDKNKKDAAAQAALAAKQMRHAASNAGGAAETAAGHVKDEIVEGAVEAKTRFQELTHRMVYTEVGRGVLFISLGLLTAGIGIRKFQEAKTIRDALLRENLTEGG